MALRKYTTTNYYFSCDICHRETAHLDSEWEAFQEAETYQWKIDSKTKAAVCSACVYEQGLRQARLAAMSYDDSGDESALSEFDEEGRPVLGTADDGVERIPLEEWERRQAESLPPGFLSVVRHWRP